MKNNKICPNETDIENILKLDESNVHIETDLTEIKKAYDLIKNALISQGMEKLVPDYDGFIAEKDYAPMVKVKNNTFHYLPYNFGASGASGFEMEIFNKVLNLSDFKNYDLEIYYNGEKGLTEFVINCFAKQGNYWKPAGKYTTDFLIINRLEKNKIHKALLIETKGGLYALDPQFQKKKQYVETEFLKLNADKFGYKKFDFLYLEDGNNITANIVKLNSKINQFFKS